MASGTQVILSETIITTLCFIERYRYLTVKQVAMVTRLKPKSASEMLLRLQRQKLLGFFGNVPLRGFGKTPKLYFLTRRGHGLLQDELGAMDETIAPYRRVNRTSRWSPMMFHRIATLDVLMAVERDVASMPSYSLPTTLVEYRRKRCGGAYIGETTDFVYEPLIGENKIVPDAGFVLENIDTKSRALFLIEVDLGTMTHQSSVAENVSRSFCYKIQKYEQYLLSERYKAYYKRLGDFSYFQTLIITNSEKRIENMRAALSEFSPQLHQYYRFSTLEEVSGKFFHSNWRGRPISDYEPHALIKQGESDESRHQARRRCAGNAQKENPPQSIGAC